jgi:pre-mRNA-splicing factor 38A
VDDLLVKERVCATSLWKMPARDVLEDLEVLEARVSPLGDIEELLEEDDDDDEGEGRENGRDSRGSSVESGEDREGDRRMDVDESEDDRSSSRSRRER